MTTVTFASTIYVLHLEGGQYYVGKTDNIRTIYQELTSSTTKTLIKTIVGCSSFEEDKIVKELMATHGIDKVRGGSYVTDTLTESQKRHIQREIWTAQDRCTNCGSPDHLMKACVVKLSQEPDVELVVTEKAYIPSAAVAARMVAVKEEKRRVEQAAAAAFEKAMEEGKIEWEAEILLQVEEGRLPPPAIMALPIESWPEHDMKENVRRCKAAHHTEDEKVAFKTHRIHWNQPGHKRYMTFLPPYAFQTPILPHFYSTIVSKSTVLNETLDLAAALDCIQMGLVPEVIDAFQRGPVITPLIKERAKFRIDLLRRLYPTLQTS